MKEKLDINTEELRKKAEDFLKSEEGQKLIKELNEQGKKALDKFKQDSLIKDWSILHTPMTK
jgi:hypothetical protein